MQSTSNGTNAFNVVEPVWSLRAELGIDRRRGQRGRYRSAPRLPPIGDVLPEAEESEDEVGDAPGPGH